MGGNPVRGGSYLFRGFGMLMEPGLRSFVLIPMLINILLFALAIYLLITQFAVWMEQLLAWVPSWLSFVDWLLWPVFALLVLVSVYFSFGVVANFIAAPFNGFLAERVEQRLRGTIGADESWQALLATVPGALARELAKLRYMLPRFLLVLILTFIPVVNLAAPLFWFMFGAWMMAIQYCDYPMDNNKVSFAGLRDYLKARRMSSLGFGALVSVGMLVPVLNLLIMPAAVVGATIFWVEEFAPSAIPMSANESDRIASK